MKHTVIYCRKCGFRHLNPIPDKLEMANFYKNNYYQQGAPKLLNFKKEARENKWAALLWQDKLEIFQKHVSKGRRILLDVGCGNGFFLEFMKKRGWHVTGIEPSLMAFKRARSKLKEVFNLTLEEFIKKDNAIYSAINLTNVLEHAPDPRGVLEICKERLDKKYGIICVEVPNDFNSLQLLYKNAGNNREYWIKTPDHINYFDFESIERLLESVGFRVIHKTADFPMELFLLMGEDYVNDSKLGQACHEKRMRLEMFLSSRLKNRLYQSLASIGIGRNCIIYARTKK